MNKELRTFFFIFLCTFPLMEKYKKITAWVLPLNSGLYYTKGQTRPLLYSAFVNQHSAPTLEHWNSETLKL